jgi:hypothetical protein
MLRRVLVLVAASVVMVGGHVGVVAGVTRAQVMSRLPRVVSGWSVPLLGLVLLAAGCSSAGQGASAGPQRHQSLPPDCTHTITRAADVPVALDTASPGNTVCFSGGDLADTDVTMTRSGTTAAPIRLVSDGGTVHSVQITADHVILEGFTVADGEGVLLRGAGITAGNNTVRDTQRGGVTCDACTDSTIESNTIAHVATAGIWITGQRITVHANTISGTVPEGDSDADGMRFFGNGHRITDNTIFDISARGYLNPPHPDCFQTYDENSPPTFDVVISGNTCRNVDAQCLIATGDQHHNSDAPAGIPSITFVGNTCAANGAQAINLRRWPNVVIRQDKLGGPNITRGVIIIDGSTGATVIGNTTTDGRPTVDIDDSSRQGSHAEANSPA